MAEQIADKNIVEIRKLLKGKNALIGADETLKNLKLGRIIKIYLSANCSDKAKSAIDHYIKLNKVEVIQLKYLNDELGILCKKPFSISVLSVLK
ncbi:MAG: ribosomal L7Ae/L30e/S12e/Gadd45 family protein [Nanoarchaeota archaeon]|nr:ribosomal L7Ae/L30e/S12e/Gadd45 family protein [Nanoarchaeota archaeon]MBU1005880.1 ribosomal L7Ae/L30e/S12e/Gadd45 family protein [Nanoarchaeota archaeon]MBU1946024.1 ribosomal L7Ae/L30e/S12e/Gadd45 family protein [Nanoarchaeota archaeon]